MPGKGVCGGKAAATGDKTDATKLNLDDRLLITMRSV
jgi:hypothetical protein